VIQKKKKYGQHFLTDKNIASKIVSGLTAQKSKIVVEVGPGEGILTNYLINRFNTDLFLVEIDHELITVLHEKFPLLKEQIFHTDFLDLNLKDTFKQEISVIGNFPYNISSQILFNVIEFRENVVELVGMFQKEVAKRICSGPGTKDYGILSVLTQAFYHTQYLFSVSKNVFSPPPKVESGVIRLERKENFKLECNEKLFQKIVKQAFQQRRKTLRNSLRSIINDRINHDQITNEIFNNRPEDLSFNDFIFITNLLG
jgi:16S rRNA (adenine1518-N6/adenine1519-N6)-dimethyltransferase